MPIKAQIIVRHIHTHTRSYTHSMQPKHTQKQATITKQNTQKGLSLIFIAQVASRHL